MRSCAVRSLWSIAVEFAMGVENGAAVDSLRETEMI